MMYQYGEFGSKPETVFVKGGGFIKIDKEKKTVEIYGKSLTFPRPEKELLERILAKAFPGYSTNVRISDETRAFD